MLRLAVVDISALAEEAFPAKGLYVDGYTVTYLDIVDLRPYSLHNTDHLMTYGYSGHSLRHAAMLYMKVTRADAS